ncbi:MAG: hypothetical protein HYR56_10060 [Acidobacteria bacterium]|nr:hypothetical protein [Acidobacteriota bacterium]MBI3423621.1 hypothetical protein [Acidobacteriota bacterium]
MQAARKASASLSLPDDFKAPDGTLRGTLCGHCLKRSTARLNNRTQLFLNGANILSYNPKGKKTFEAAFNPGLVLPGLVLKEDKLHGGRRLTELVVCPITPARF